MELLNPTTQGLDTVEGPRARTRLLLTQYSNQLHAAADEPDQVRAITADMAANVDAVIAMLNCGE